MKIKGVIFEDFINYKVPSMYVAFPSCTFKCGKENCQNQMLTREPELEVEAEHLVELYMKNPITSAFVMGGLEPFDSINDLENFVQVARTLTNDPIIIYTGYLEEEIEDKVARLITHPNIIIKFGRYIPSEEPYRNEILGVELAGRNQYVVAYHTPQKEKENGN